VNPAIGSVDVAVLAAYLLGVVLLGVWVGRGQPDLADYLLGGRRLPWWALLLSIVATETSTVTFLSVPGLAFRPDGGNLLFLQLALGYVLGRLVVVLLFLPQYFRGELFTAYEVLDRRFGGATKQAASLLFLVTRNLADGLRLFLTALVLQAMLGVDLWICVTVIGTATITYTFAGGMKSVVWNDCVQFVVYLAGAVTAGVIILACLGAGSTDLANLAESVPRGWARLSTFAEAHGKFRLFDFSLDLTRPYTFWSGLIGGCFVALATHGTDQLMVQRYLSARSQREAGWALALSGLLVAGQFALFLLVGVGLACFYDLFSLAAPISGDEVFAAFIVGYLPVGVTGVVLAAVFSAAMSTLSSSLNSSAAAAVNDLYLPRQKTRPSPRRLLRVSRGLTIAFGAVQIGVAMLGRWLAGIVVERVMAIASFTIGVILGVFFLGVFVRRAGQTAALTGLLTGLTIMAAIVLGTDLAWPWFALAGSSITFFAGGAAAFLLPAPTASQAGRRREADQDTEASRAT
jgi:SSS family solute:Na+ symporter